MSSNILYIVLLLISTSRFAVSSERTEKYFRSIKDNPLKLRMFLRDMPKGGDLHNHLSGAIYAESFLKWALEKNLCFTAGSYSATTCSGDSVITSNEVRSSPEIYRQIIDAWSMRNSSLNGKSGHDQFFDTFGKFGFAGTGKLGDMLREAMTRAANNNLSYVEYMITINGSGVAATTRDLTWNDNVLALRDSLITHGLRDTLRRGSQILNTAEAVIPKSVTDKITVRYLYQVGRGTSALQSFAQILAGFELAEIDDRVVGINLVMPEDYPVPLELFFEQMNMINTLRPLYKKAHITLHAGEFAFGMVPPEVLCCHIQESIAKGHAERIGHGVSVAYENQPQSLLSKMAMDKVLVEVCLTSNDVILGVKNRNHPFRLYMENGVPLALATDDEGVSRSDITNEFQKAVTDQDATYTELKAMVFNSIKYSFVQEPFKTELLESLNKQFIVFESKWK